MPKYEYEFYVYIMASNSGTLYTGVTNNLIRRVEEHKQGKIEGFTKKYKCNKLIYYEYYEFIYDALEREKQLKNWNRKKKEELIRSINPHWHNLYNELQN